MWLLGAAVVSATAGDAFMDLVFALLTTTTIAKQKLLGWGWLVSWRGFPSVGREGVGLTPGQNNKRKYENPSSATRKLKMRRSPYKQTHVRIRVRSQSSSWTWHILTFIRRIALPSEYAIFIQIPRPTLKGALGKNNTTKKSYSILAYIADGVE